MIEVEQKYRVASPDELLLQLQQAGFRQTGDCKQIDAYFQHPQRDFVATDEAFRLRLDGNQWCVSYKGPKQDGPCKQRFELELPLQSTANTRADWHELLTRLGFRFVSEVVKYRRSFGNPQHKNVTVTVDQLELSFRQYFCEIEIIATDDETESAARAIESLASSLELDDVVTQSYLSMVLSSQDKLS